jgi:hypothetical protein
MPPDHRSNGFPYQQPDRHDELTDGIPVPTECRATAGAQKRTRGLFTSDDAETKALAKKGGETKRGTTTLSHRIDAPCLSPESQRRARTLRRALSAEIASTVGGGHCGVAASLLIKFAAEKTAAAQEAFARGDYELHRKLTESARMDVLYAREHAAKEAKARPQPTADEMNRALLAAAKERA